MSSVTHADCTAAIEAADERTHLRREVQRLRDQNKNLIAALGSCRYVLELSRKAPAGLFATLREDALEGIAAALK